MTDASFQPQGYLRFDLSQGLASTPDKRRHLVLPAEVLRAVGNDESLDDAARSWGEEQGTSLANLVGDDVLTLPPERFVTELSHLMATLGWGWCTMESWGGVAFVLVQQAPRGGGLRILKSFLAGAFSTASGLKFDCVAIPDGSTCRFLLTGPESSATIQGWVDAEASAGEVANRMLEGAHLSEVSVDRG